MSECCKLESSRQHKLHTETKQVKIGTSLRPRNRSMNAQITDVRFKWANEEVEHNKMHYETYQDRKTRMAS